MGKIAYKIRKRKRLIASIVAGALAFIMILSLILPFVF